MSKFFVVYGYCGPDNYTSSAGPILKVKEFQTAAEVEDFYPKFLESIGSDNSDVTFRIFEGVERSLKPEEKVTKFKLG